MTTKMMTRANDEQADRGDGIQNTLGSRLPVHSFASSSTTKHIIAFGGGLDSSALLAINLKRDEAAALMGIDRVTLDAAFPKVDAVMFSDTGAERKATYANIAKFEAAYKAAGLAFYTVRNSKETIVEWLLRLGCLPLMPGSSHKCSLKFKTEVMHSQSEQIFPDADKFVWSIGIEANEDRRANKSFQDRSDLKHSSTYPLRNLKLDRAACADIVMKLGFGIVVKSACVFCPFAQVEEIAQIIRDEPEGWALVKQIEAKFQETSPIKHQAWLDAGQPLNKGGKAPKGMWRKDSWASGARLFAKKVDGKMLSTEEWEAQLAPRTAIDAIVDARLTAWDAFAA
jgi:3'-phosphoadenosine 5'-phosphosulfate sulfotransferase (PAPS reductase)/FAD synthetase